MAPSASPLDAGLTAGRTGALSCGIAMPISSAWMPSLTEKRSLRRDLDLARRELERRRGGNIA